MASVWMVVTDEKSLAGTRFSRRGKPLKSTPAERTAIRLPSAKSAATAGRKRL
ncbi:MAG: hypothetical protein SPG44_08035 [Megasphaera elsdenii]|uniref:hypothetical protein n=1 Tax=Megasphaera TaxID=906 RepID=UPI00258103AD|nr:hypothetical protein [Megasphaera sp.]MCI6924605.1 hypothetical protein [Megasphaera elsdenii]MDD7069937.1 hypothetical protein [Megasphaera elsdenii]MDY5386730.1 hypothetical protein [Megasphaera elsdenii]